jgi:hypothetical protein
LLLDAFWRRRFGDLRTYKAYQKKLDQAEEMAEGKWKPKRGQAGWIGHRRNAYFQVVQSVPLLAGLRGKGHVSLATQASLIREIFGNPLRGAAIQPSWLDWNGGAVVRIAQGIDAERAFDRLPVLADALEEAGCTDPAILSHCRGPGPHVRGCWVLDLLTGRE